MANRPVFLTLERQPYYSTMNAEFPWAGGFAVSQKQKNIAAMHRCFQLAFPGKRVLEISGKSTEPLGVAASAFRLTKYVPSLGRSVPVENVFQSAKTFSGGGPYADLLEAAPIDAKRDPRLSTSGELRCFRWEGREYPLIPRTIFYDYVYLNALLEHPELGDRLAEYDAFTDVVFNPQKSLNCQARSAAIYVSLRRLGLLTSVRAFEDFRALFLPAGAPKPPERPAPRPADRETPAPARPGLRPGSRIRHPAFGSGRITAVEGPRILATFEAAGERTLSAAWVTEHCTLEEE